MSEDIFSRKEELVQILGLNESMADFFNRFLERLRNPALEDGLQLCQILDGRGTLLHLVTSAIFQPSEHRTLLVELFDRILTAAKEWEDRSASSVILQEKFDDWEYPSVFSVIVEAMDVPLLRKVLDEYVCLSNENKLDVSSLITTGDDRCFEKCCRFYCFNYDGKHSRIEAILAQASKKDAIEDIRDIKPIQVLMESMSHLTSKLYIFAVIWHLVYISVFSYACLDLLDPGVNQTRLSTSIIFYTVGLTEPVFLTLHLTRDVFILFVTSGWVCEECKTEDFKMFLISLKRLVFLLPYMVMLYVIIFTIDHPESSSRYYIISGTILWGWLLTFRLSFGIESIHFFTEALDMIIKQNVAKILVAYMIFLAGYSLAIHVQFMASSTVSYKTLAHTLFLMFNIMMGMGDLFDEELESSLESAGISPVFSKLLYVSYLVFVSIILLNLLIAMMNASYSLLKDHHSPKWKLDSTVEGLVVARSFPCIAKLFCSKLRRDSGNVWFINTEQKSGCGREAKCHPVPASVQPQTITMETTAPLGNMSDSVKRLQGTGQQIDANMKTEFTNKASKQRKILGLLQDTVKRVEDLTNQQSNMDQKLDQILLQLSTHKA